MNKPTIQFSSFGRMPDGAEAGLYTLRVESGIQLSITNFGAAVTSLLAPDLDGNYADVVLGYDTLAGYLGGKSFFGATVGRFGNRIAKGRFTIDGVECALPQNNGSNHLHGGPLGFNRFLWQAQMIEAPEGPALKLTRTSPDGEQGYPGNLAIEVTYRLIDEHSFAIHYRAETDCATPVNLTNHAFFNLRGHDSGNILGHELTLFSDRFTEVDSELIPTGEFRETHGTAFDFRGQPIGRRISDDDDQLRLGGGYDHNFVLQQGADGAPVRAALVHEPKSGRTLEVLTTEPGVQFYSGNFLDGTEVGKGGAVYGHRNGFCLETQHFPDSPNQCHFPNTIVRPGEVYESTTIYRFGARRPS